MKRVIQQLSTRSLVTTSQLNVVDTPKVIDNPKFYAMVLQFTKDSAKILESKLLDNTDVDKKGRSENVRKAQIEAANRSEDQRKKTIRGIFDFMLPCNSILETNFRVKMDDGTTKVRTFTIEYIRVQ